MVMLELANCTNAWATDLEGELTAVIGAATAFSTDASDANCNAYKSAYQDYINALKPYGNCATLVCPAWAITIGCKSQTRLDSRKR